MPKRQIPLPVVYDGVRLNVDYRLDLVINDLSELSEAEISSPAFFLYETKINWFDEHEGCRRMA